MKTTITHERLVSLLRYDRETGAFVWAFSGRGWAKEGRPAGGKRSDGYLAIRLDGRLYYLHRLAWFYAHGHWPKGLIDHINGVKYDNRLCNLREVTNAENQQNQRTHTRRLRGGLLGVSLEAKSNRWSARIKTSGKTQFLGVFDTETEAHAAYVNAKRKLHPAFVEQIPSTKDHE